MSDKQLSGLRARRLGFVFQQFFLLDGLSVLDNVADGLLYRGGRVAERRELAASRHRAGRAQPPRRPPAQPALRRRAAAHRHRPSPGRAAGAWSWPTSPPATSTRPPGRPSWNCCGELHDEGTTILVITHDLDVAAAMDRRIEIRDGRVLNDTSS